MKTLKNHLRSPGERTISWGKYAGKKFSEVPSQYLEWFKKNGYSQMKNRVLWAEQELARRSRLEQKNLAP